MRLFTEGWPDAKCRREQKVFMKKHYLATVNLTQENLS